MRGRIEKIVEEIQYVIYSVTGKENLQYKCEVVSTFAFLIFQRKQLSSSIVHGEFKLHPDGETHMWNMVEGIPIDFTISQFGNYENGIIEPLFYETYFEIFEIEEEYDDHVNLHLLRSYLKKYEQTFPTT